VPPLSQILVVEDDLKTAELIRLYLDHEGFGVTVITDGAKALEQALRTHPDVIVLDLMLPGLDGLELCRRLRSESEAPVIMVTARVTEEDKVAGLAAGADDYVAKPFSPRELVARVRAVLRRAGPQGRRARTRFHFDGLVVDTAAREVTVDGDPVALTRSEFDLLEAFCRAAGAALTRTQLVEDSFGHDYDGLERTVDAHIAKLRKKIRRRNGGPDFIATVVGVGYKFVARRTRA
jgi:DNA-binding response OmpR family regulator